MNFVETGVDLISEFTLVVWCEDTLTPGYRSKGALCGRLDNVERSKNGLKCGTSEHKRMVIHTLNYQGAPIFM